MIKGFLPMLYTGAGVTAAGVTGYVVVERENIFPSDPPAIVQTEQEAPKQEIVTLLPKAEPEPEPQTEVIVEQVLPVFSLLRVEKDGSVVIAGTGPGDSAVTLLNGDRELASTTSGSEGDFAFVLDQPLKPGSHELVLKAVPKNGTPVFSAEAGLINIPDPETQDEVTVLVAEAGEATRILQKPEEPEPEEVKEEEVEVAAVAPETTPEPETPIVETEAAEQEEVSEPEPVAEVEPVEEAVIKEPEKVEEPAKSIQPVLLEAADIEDDMIFIAGTAEPESKIILYLDNELLGSTSAGTNGAFLYEGNHNIERGDYKVRADMVEKSDGKVLARALVKLVHRPEVEVAAVEAPAVVEEPAETQPKEEPVVEAAPIETESPAQPETAEEPEIQVVAASQREEVAEPETAEPAVKEIRTGSAVIIRRGDSLWRVARRNYGQGIRYTTIFDANREQIRDPNLIYPGQILKVPEGEQAEDASSSG